MDIDDEPQGPTAPELAPLQFKTGERAVLYIEFEVDEVRFTTVRKGDGLSVTVDGALGLDELIQLRDKMITPVIEHLQALKAFRDEEAARSRAEFERERLERERESTFRAVQVHRTVTPNMTVHSTRCASLASARLRQSPLMTVYALTPSDLIAKIPTALTGRLKMHFCVKCKPIEGAQLVNAELYGGAWPLTAPVELLQKKITDAIWDAHHAALRVADQKENDE